MMSYTIILFVGDADVAQCEVRSSKFEVCPFPISHFAFRTSNFECSLTRLHPSLLWPRQSSPASRPCALPSPRLLRSHPLVRPQPVTRALPQLPALEAQPMALLHHLPSRPLQRPSSPAAPRASQPYRDLPQMLPMLTTHALTLQP